MSSEHPTPPTPSRPDALPPPRARRRRGCFVRRRRLLENRRGGRHEQDGVGGVAPWRGGVFVAAPPDIWYLKDTKGDHRANIRRHQIKVIGIADRDGHGLLRQFFDLSTHCPRTPSVCLSGTFRHPGPRVRPSAPGRARACAGTSPWSSARRRRRRSAGTRAAAPFALGSLSRHDRT